MNHQANIIDLRQQNAQDARSVLDEIVREGARRMLQAAIEEEAVLGAQDGQRARQTVVERLRKEIKPGWYDTDQIVGSRSYFVPSVHALFLIGWCCPQRC